jgi:hypothetical protein
MAVVAAAWAGRRAGLWMMVLGPKKTFASRSIVCLAAELEN